MNDVNELNILMKSEAISGWNFLLQKGFSLRGRAGATVREFLRESVGYDDCLIDEKVRTIFLNSSPMDDIDTTHVKEGDRLALGSAMPGLVGICMGRDNPYKEFRSGIAARKNAVEETARPVMVFVKVFSTLAVDTGVDLLGRGIEINAAILADFLKEKAEFIVKQDGVSAEAIVSSLREMEGDIRIRVRFQ